MEDRPRSQSVLQMRSSTFQVASKFLKKVSNIGLKGSNRTSKGDKNSDEPYVRDICSMDVSHKPFMSQPTLGLQMPNSHIETDYSSRSVSSCDSSVQHSRQISPSNVGHPGVQNHRTSHGHPNGVGEHEKRGRRRMSADNSRRNHDHASDRLPVSISGTSHTLVAGGRLLPSLQPGIVSGDSSHPSMHGHFFIPTKFETSTVSTQPFLNRKTSVRNERMDAKSKSNASPRGTMGESSRHSTSTNSGEVSIKPQPNTSTPTPLHPTRVISNLPPPSLNRIGSTRLTPSIVMRHPPLPILRLPTLSPPTPSQSVSVPSRTRLRNMPALPVEGPGDHEMEADHENAGLGDSDEEENGETDMDSNGHIGIEIEDNGRESLELTRSGQSEHFPPQLVLPAVDISHFDLSFLDQPSDSVLKVHRGQDPDKTPTTSRPLDYFSSHSNRHLNPSPTLTPRQGNMQFSRFSMMQNSPDNQFTIPRLSSPPPRGSMYRHPSISMVDLGSKSMSDAGVTAAVNFEMRSNVVQGKGKARESSNAISPVPSESTITERHKKVSEAPSNGTLLPLRRRGSMPNFNRTSVPPPYPSFAPHPMSKYTTIVPREEEGMERLPSYTNSIYLTAIMPRKMEFSAPGIQAKDRKWRRVLCVLEGTVFKVYQCPREAAGVGPIEEWWEKRVGVGDVSATPNLAVQDGRMKTEGLQRSNMQGQTKLDLDRSHTAGTHQAHSTSRPQRSAGANLSRHLSQTRSRGRKDTIPVDSSQSSLIMDGRSRTGHSPSNLSVATSRLTPSPSSSRSHIVLGSHPTETARLEAKAGLIRAYTMQHGESGLGNDYIKRKNVIRLRLEGEQFLLQALDVASVVEWIEGFQAAANIALDLDERVMPKGPFFPRRRRRRPRRTEGTPEN